MTEHTEADHRIERIELHEKLRTAESQRERTEIVRRLATIEDDGQADIYRKLAREQ